MATRELLQTEDPIEKWRREGEAKDRAFEQESERRQAEEARIVREQRQAAEMHEVLLDAIGAAMAEYVGKKLAKLEARLDALETKQRSVDDGDVVDLPSPLLRKRSSNAA